MHIAGSALLKEAQHVGGERHRGQPRALNGCLFDSKIKWQLIMISTMIASKQNCFPGDTFVLIGAPFLFIVIARHLLLKRFSPLMNTIITTIMIIMTTGGNDHCYFQLLHPSLMGWRKFSFFGERLNFLNYCNYCMMAVVTFMKSFWSEMFGGNRREWGRK